MNFLLFASLVMAFTSGLFFARLTPNDLKIAGGMALVAAMPCGFWLEHDLYPALIHADRRGGAAIVGYMVAAQLGLSLVEMLPSLCRLAWSAWNYPEESKFSISPMLFHAFIATFMSADGLAVTTLLFG